MAYFVTGGTGFIGTHFIEKLTKDRQGDIYVLVRSGSREKFEALQARVGDQASRLIAVEGDLTQPQLAVEQETIAALRGKIAHFFHLAAIYDLDADAESQKRTNIEGTRHAVQLAEAVEAGCFQHVSSIAAGGMYEGTFREDMFEEAEGLDHPYFATKHESEGVVRRECSIPWRVYRPSLVMGHSKTGEISKVDGVYYMFKTLQKLRRMLPPWAPLLGLEGGIFNMVPVDYVVDAMDHIAHKEDIDGRCFHLTDPAHYSMGDSLNIFAEAGHTPRFSMRLDKRVFSFVPRFVRETVMSLPPVKHIISTILEDMGMPGSSTMLLDFRTRYDNRDAERALKGSGIKCPNLRDYAPVIWDYWERNLDPDLFVDNSLEGNIGGKVVMITGASSGIGRAAALRLAEAGAHVLLVARSQDKLEEVAAEIADLGGTASVYAGDLSNVDDCERVTQQALEDHGLVDILVNNAGRSIRRSIELSFDRFHDYQRTMQLNYFGAVKMILGLSPSMLEARKGHIINISSIVALSPTARFSAYAASKSALDAFTHSAAIEFSDRNVRFTSINYPLVRTPMVKATTVYDSLPLLTIDEAVDMLVEAIIKKPKRVATNAGVFMQVMNAIAPRLTEVVSNIGFQLFSDSAAARGDKKPEKVEASKEQVALAALMKGVHF